jgi:hypothetical protein
MNYKTLKDKQRQVRGSFSDALGLRVHRAISWLNKAELSQDDKDSQYIFLWISFNSAYAQNLDEELRTNETTSFSLFINKLVDLDTEKKLDKIVWQEFASSIRLLLNNRYVFQPFWDHVGGKISDEEWRSSFDNANNAANRALGEQDTSKLLSIVLYRLYTLRNQLIHGGATWQSSANREQIRDGVAFLNCLVPLIIDIMMNSPDTLWGDASYPIVNL